MMNLVTMGSLTGRYSFDCNIQQVKRKEFDLLYYGLFFADKIEVYKMTSKEKAKARKAIHSGQNRKPCFTAPSSPISFSRAPPRIGT